MSSGKSIPENAGECCRMRDPCLHGEDKEPVENFQNQKGKGRYRYGTIRRILAGPWERRPIILAEKNRRAAQINRIRAVIRLTEKKTAEKEYIALGRYYYHNLRDKENAVTEPHCAALDQAEKALDAALDKLDRVLQQ